MDVSSSTGGHKEEKKYDVDDQGLYINLRVKAQDGGQDFFKIKRNAQLQKLMNTFCNRQSLEVNTIAFLFDGRKIRGEQTPEQIGVEDGDEIDAMWHQIGGGQQFVLMSVDLDQNA